MQNTIDLTRRRQILAQLLINYRNGALGEMLSLNMYPSSRTLSINVKMCRIDSEKRQKNVEQHQHDFQPADDSSVQNLRH